MGVAYYIVPKRKIRGFDPMVNGKPLAHAPEKVLKAICLKAGVKDLVDFSSTNPEEAAAFH